MKSIIDGRRYNTEAPQTVCVANNGRGCGGDFSAYHEGLYRTGKGNWFLCGTGGPMTKYAVHDGNMTSGSSKIIPISKDEAREWLELWDETDVLEEYFFDSIEDA